MDKLNELALSPEDAKDGALQGQAAPQLRSHRQFAVGLVARYGVLLALVLTISMFSLLKPQYFPTTANAKAILQQLAPLAILAFALTVPLVMGDFDLSTPIIVGLGGAVVVNMMAVHTVPVPLSIAAGLAVGVAAGLLNGWLVAGLGASSFIITLATSQVYTGLEYQITSQNTIFEGLTPGYLEIATGRSFGVSNGFWIAMVVFGLLFVLLEHTEVGRYMYAIGGNREAARLSGVPVRRYRMLGFVIAAVCGVVAGIVLTSQSAAYSPNLGTAFFLPAYAAAFLGAAVVRPGEFNLLGTLIGALLLEVIATGLTMLRLTTAVILIVEGVILAAAVLLSRVNRGGSSP